MTGRSPSPSRSDTSASSAHSLSYQNILNNNNNITENNEHIIMLRKHRSHNRHLDSPSPTGQVSMPSKLYFSYKISFSESLKIYIFYLSQMSPEPKNHRRDDHHSMSYNQQDDERILMLRKRSHHIDSPSPPPQVKEMHLFSFPV